MKNSEKRKKNTTRKRKTENNSLSRYHWTAFDEPGLSKTKVNALAHELLDGVKNGRFATITGFRAQHLISDQRWDQMCDQFPFLANANEAAKGFIYERRIKDAHEKKLDSRLISNDQLTLYCNEYKKHYRWLRSLDEEKQNKASLVVLESIKDYEKHLENKKETHEQE